MLDRGLAALERFDPRDGDRSAVLDRIIARAASPAERVGSPYFRVADARLEGPWTDRELAWARSAAGTAEAFQTLLAFRGIPIDHWRLSTRDAVIAGGPDRPCWVDDLRRLFGRDHPPGPPVPPFQIGEIGDRDVLIGLGLDLANNWSLHRRFEPLLSVAAAELTSVVGRSGVAVSAQAERQILTQLTRRWSAATALLMHEVVAPAGSAARLAALSGPETAWFTEDRTPVAQWVRLIDAYPVMGRIMAVVFRNWLDATAEALARLAADYARLTEVLGGGRPLGTLVAYSADAGDGHESGRSVTILTFASGARVAYKPKDLRVAALYLDLVDILNDAGLTLRLHRRQIVIGDGYAWEEYIAPLACPDAAAVRRYYVRMGMHARLFQLLTGLDFTTDNFIAHGEWPVPIDLELLMSARMPPLPTASATEATLRLVAWDSPHHSGVITARIIGDFGRRAAEMGALATVEQRVAPFKQMVVRRGADGAPCIIRDYPTLPREVPTPELDGVRVRPALYFPDVERGYRLMGRCLHRVAHRLAARGGIIDRLADARLRFLCRDTHLYTRLIQESCHPLRLRDGVEREMCLERLWRARFSDPAIVTSEVDAIRELDVPLFTSRAGGDSITVRGGHDVPGFFDGSPVTRVRERLAGLSRPDWRREADLIGTALFMLDPTARRAPPQRPLGRRGSRPERFLAVAAAIGDDLLKRGITAAPGEIGWVGVNYLPGSDAWGFGGINYDILTGMGGLAILFADLHRATGRPRYWRVGRTLVALIRRRLETVAVELGRAGRSGEHVPRLREAAGMHGWGSWLYAGVRASETLADRDAARDLVGLIAGIDPTTLARCAGTDLVSGLAGLLLALLRSARTDGGRPLWPHAAHVGHALLERREAGGRFPELLAPPGATTLAILPDAQRGVALALLRLAECRDQSGFVLSAAERRDLVALVADDSGPLTPGIHLARLACARVVPALRCEALEAAAAYLEESGTDLTTSETLARGEIALAAFALSGAARYLELARSLVRVRLVRWHRERCWFPELYVADRFFHSVTFGTGAVAHLALRLEHPDVTSVRILA